MAGLLDNEKLRIEILRIADLDPKVTSDVLISTSDQKGNTAVGALITNANLSQNLADLNKKDANTG